MIGSDKIREGRREGIENSHSEGNRGDDGNDPVDRRVGRESDPEETDRDEDTACLTHDEPEFRPDGTVFLDLPECEPIQTRQLRDKWKVMRLIPIPERL